MRRWMWGERDLVLVPEAEAIRGCEQHHRLGEKPHGSRRRGNNDEGWVKQDEGPTMRRSMR